MKLQQSNHVDHVFIHESLLTEILYRVSARTLLRFKPVCKQWCSLIEDPFFIEKHFVHVERNHSMIGLAIASFDKAANNGSIFLSLFERGREKGSRWNCVQDDDHHDIPMTKIAGLQRWDVSMLECKGLICLCHKDIKIICNPTTKECVTLPIETSDDDDIINCDREYAFGFGYSWITKQYKLVELIRKFNTEHNKFMITLKVFTLGVASKSWRTVSLAEDTEFIDADGIFVNDSIYWYINMSLPHSNHVVLCFDIESERFRFIKLAADSSIVNYYLVKRNNDGPSLVRINECQLYDNGIATYDIWTLKKDPGTNQDLWIKDYCIDLRAPVHSTLRPFCIHNRRLYNLDAAGLVSYDLDDGTAEQIVLPYKQRRPAPEEVFSDAMDIHVYNESLFSLVSWGLKVNYLV